jgi:hypothetical protein
MNKNKIIGTLMVAPLPIYLVYLLLAKEILPIVICLAAGVGLFHFGLKLLTGSTLEEVGEDVVRHLDEVEEEAEEAVDKIKKKTRKPRAKKAVKKS